MKRLTLALLVPLFGCDVAPKGDATASIPAASTAAQTEVEASHAALTTVQGAGRKPVDTTADGSEAKLASRRSGIIRAAAATPKAVKLTSKQKKALFKKIGMGSDKPIGI